MFFYNIFSNASPGLPTVEAGPSAFKRKYFVFQIQFSQEQFEMQSILFQVFNIILPTTIGPIPSPTGCSFLNAGIAFSLLLPVPL